jgi:hypothetical protein
MLVVAIGTSAFAGELQQTAATAAQQQEEKAPARSSAKPLVWTGTALFVGGMAVGLYGFLNDRNGTYSEFGESTAVNKPLGAAGVAAAFAGGALIFLGTRRARHAPSVTVTANRIAVSKQLSW